MMYVGRFLFAFAFCLSFFITACGREELSNSLIPAAAGRFGAETADYPGVVMILAPGNTLCTGAIISPYAVLTAYHCTDSSGVYTVRTSAGDFETTQIELHAEGKGVVDDPHDIAILVFEAPITENPEEIYPIASSVSKGDAVAVVGFGCNSVERRSGAGVKRAGTNRISEKGEYLYLLTPRVSFDRGIIGDSNQSGTCFGDSGGPLLRLSNSQLEIVGVTHAGGRSSSFYVSEFVNVADNASNREFLRNVASEHSLEVRGI